MKIIHFLMIFLAPVRAFSEMSLPVIADEFIDMLPKYVPGFEKNMVTEKTLDYIRYVAKTWPITRSNKCETESLVNGSDSIFEIVSIYGEESNLFPGVMSSVSKTFHNYNKLNPLYNSNFEGKETITYGLDAGMIRLLSSISGDIRLSCNVTDFGGNLIPLEIGNKFYSSFECISETGVDSIYKMISYNNRVISIDKVITGSDVDGFPVEIPGKIFVFYINTDTITTEKLNNPDLSINYPYIGRNKYRNNTSITMFYSEYFSTFLPIAEPIGPKLKNLVFKIKSFELK